MRNYLATITLNKDYSGTAVDSSELSDLENWYGFIGTTNVVQSPTSFYYEIIAGTESSIVSNALNYPFGIGSEFGLDFKISFDVLIHSGGSTDMIHSFQLVVNGQPMSGFNIYTSPYSAPYSENVTPHHVEFEFNTSSFAIGEVRINVLRANNSIFSADYTFTNMLIEAINNDTDFDTGDSLLVYYNDVTDGIEVDHQHALTLISDISEGPDLGVLLDSQFFYCLLTGVDPNIKISYYAFCLGDGRNEFWSTNLNPSFPYFEKKIILSSPYCVPAIVCDIQYTASVIILQYPSSPYAQDGSFRVFASSRYVNDDNPIKYSLQSPAEATYQSLEETNEGIFENVGVGDYIIYAYDRYNCVTPYYFTFTVDLSGYDTLYRQEFKDIQSLVLGRLDIKKRGYSGNVNDEISDGAEPLVLSKLSGDVNNKFEAVRQTNAVISLISDTNFKFIGLFSQTDRLFMSVYEKPVGTEVWRGFVTPSIFSEPYKSTPYPVSITATDGLSLLNDEDFLDEGGNTIVGRKTIIDILVICLKKTGLILGIKSSVNKYAYGFATGVNDDPLDQTYVDVSCFYDDDETPVKCDEVLTELLTPFGAEIIQSDGWWNVVEIEGKTQSYAYRTFTSEGEKVVGGNGTFDPIISIVSPNTPGILFKDQDANLEIIPAYGKITIIHELKLKTSLLGRSLDKQWQPSLIYTTVGYVTYFDESVDDIKVIENGKIVSGAKTSKFKGLSVNNLDAAFGQKVLLLSNTAVFTTQKDSLKISFDYQHLLSQAYNDVDEGDPIVSVKVVDPKWVKLKWTLYLDVGLTTYKYSERIGWNTLSNDFYIRNEILIDKFEREFKGFDRTIVLPEFTSPQLVGIRLLFEFNGGYSEDFSSLSELAAIPTGVLPLDTKVKGRISGVYSYFYLRLADGATIDDGERNGIHDNPGLNPLPIDADHPYLRVVPNDYADPGNIVIWQEDYDEGLVIPVERIDLKKVIVTMLPNKKDPITSETITAVINTDFKEKKEFSLFLADHPVSLIHKEIYNNWFSDAAGLPTKGWKRSEFVESTSIQQVLMKQIVNQYTNPSWKISGSFVDTNNSWGFLNTIKSTIPPFVVSVPDPEFDFGFDDPTNYWQNFGPTGTNWIHKGVVELTDSDNSKYLVTTDDVDIPAGTRISVAFKFTRTGTTGSNPRVDQFVIVLFRSGIVLQEVLGLDALSYDDDFEKTVKFNTISDSDNIGFYIKNVYGEGDANYEVDYFRLSGQTVVRYFGINSLNKNDRHNDRNAELYQLIPAKLSTDPEYDDSGNGDTDPGNGSGGNEGGNFSGDYNNDYSGDFDNVLA